MMFALLMVAPKLKSSECFLCDKLSKVTLDINDPMFGTEHVNRRGYCIMMSLQKKCPGVEATGTFIVTWRSL